MEDYPNIARKIFAGTKFNASEKDIEALAGNIALLEKRCLGKLNKRLINARKHTKIFETIAEHNFAVILLSQHDSTVPISYEPDMGSKRPPDFKVEMGDITYWIQMKDLTKVERENRQDKIIQQIEKVAREIKVGKFFSCTLSDDFKDECVLALMEFIKDKATSADEGKSFLFTGKNNQKAKIEFWSARKTALSELTLGYAADLEVVELTGQAREQIKQSLLNAVGAFNWKVDQKNINLIVIEADNKEDIDICDAVFGTEYEWFAEDKHFWCREDNGLFRDSDFSTKVAGVVAIKRKRERDEEIALLSPEEVAERLSPEEEKLSSGMTPEAIKEALEWKTPGPIANYSMILYTNDNFKHLIEEIKKLLSLDRVVYYNMRPPMGQGDFEY